MNTKEALPFVSVIVLNWNRKELAEEDNLLKLGSYYVDNAPSDNSLALLAQNFPRVNILTLDKNYGFSEGNNRSARFARGKYIAFLNTDTEVDEEWLSELVL